MMTDPISDMLSQIRNALAVNKEELTLPYSNMKYAMGKILEKEGYLGKVTKTTQRKHPMINIKLQYRTDGTPAIEDMKRVSKPGRRVYKKTDELPHVLSGLGIAIVSTSNGLMTNKQARTRRLGGEIICKVS